MPPPKLYITDRSCFKGSMTGSPPSRHLLHSKSADNMEVVNSEESKNSTKNLGLAVLATRASGYIVEGGVLSSVD